MIWWSILQEFLTILNIALNKIIKIPEAKPDRIGKRYRKSHYSWRL